MNVTLKIKCLKTRIYDWEIVNGNFKSVVGNVSKSLRVKITGYICFLYKINYGNMENRAYYVGTDNFS